MFPQSTILLCALQYFEFNLYIYVSQSGFEFSIMIFWVIIDGSIGQIIFYFIFSNYTSLWYISYLRVIIMISLPSLCVFFLHLAFSNPRPHICMLTLSNLQGFGNTHGHHIFQNNWFKFKFYKQIMTAFLFSVYFI